MKKIFLLHILTIILITVLIGCNKTEKNEYSSTIESLTVEEIYKAETNDKNTIIGTLPEVLTTEDKVVKTEIAKFSDTTVDFRKNRQETVQNKTFNICFSGVNEIQGKKEVVTYKSDSNDEFLYNIDSGNLFLARINSYVEEKTDKSISIETAKKTAENYISKNSNIDELTMTLSHETSEGYLFVYTKCISKYKTNATFEIIIGFNNKIVYLRDTTDVIEELDIIIDETFIEQKKSEILSNYIDNNAVIEDVSIVVEDNKLYLITNLSYEMELNGKKNIRKIEIRSQMT